MRTRITLSLLLLVAATVSCTKESCTGIRVVANTTGFEEPSGTRTVYTGVKDETTKIERIDWVNGDLIRIYCDKATMQGSTSRHYCDYKVTGSSTSGTTCSASINPATDLNGMQWGSGTHKFYAMYPSLNTEGLSGASFESGTMVFTMPAAQTVTRKEGTCIWQPDMKYAPMLAVNSVEANASSVPLDFSPQYTAFSFTVSKTNYATIHMSEFKLTATNGNLTGTYTIVPVRDNNGDHFAFDGVENGGQSITVDLSGVVLDSSTPTLTLTVMAVPQAVSGLVISFKGQEIGTRTLALNRNGTPMSFAAFKKYNISGLTLPEVYTLDGITWDGSCNSAGVEGVDWMNTL